jgi:hypothetical protein
MAVPSEVARTTDGAAHLAATFTVSRLVTGTVTESLPHIAGAMAYACALVLAERLVGIEKRARV